MFDAFCDTLLFTFIHIRKCFTSRLIPIWAEDSERFYTLRIQVCRKKGINPTVLLWGWDWDHQTYSRESYGSLGTD